MGRYTSIGVSRDVKDRLDELRQRLGAKNWNEFFEKMLEIYSEWKSFKLEEEVKQALCREYSETRLTLPGWGEVFATRFGDPDRMAVAFKYIKPTPNAEYYVVDKELCGGGSR